MRAVAAQLVGASPVDVVFLNENDDVTGFTVPGGNVICIDGDPGPECTRATTLDGAPGYLPAADAGPEGQSIGQAAVMHGMLRIKPELANCADRAHRDEPRRTGKLLVRFDVETSGQTSGVRVVTKPTADSVFGRCVVSVLERAQFAPMPVKGGFILFPFKF